MNENIRSGFLVKPPKLEKRTWIFLEVAAQTHSVVETTLVSMVRSVAFFPAEDVLHPVKNTHF